MNFKEFISHYPNDFKSFAKAYDDVTAIKAEMEKRIIALGRRMSSSDIIAIMERMNNDPDLAKLGTPKFDNDKLKNHMENIKNHA